jgi:trehalose 6-phosphate synthase/phosphatase
VRLVVVSNRLPITVEEKGGKLLFKDSVGGLVSGISAYLSSLKSSSLDKSDYIWVGWPGISVSDKKRDEMREKGKLSNLFPVFISEKVMDKFYLGFCNKTIWPLFHYFPAYTVYDREYWEHYKTVNEVFCEEIVKIAEPDDILWIHDYHLMLLPKLLRQSLPNSNIGFFLHIPFPSFEVFRMLPAAWRTEILEGMLGADLIGFHTFDYTKYFLGCVLRILGFENNIGQIILPDRVVQAETFPMGINYEQFIQTTNEEDVKIERNELRKKFRNSKIVLSIDRLDYSKGILNRLQGYEIFLKNNPDWHGKVILLMVVVPSRIGVDRYSIMKKEIDEKVGDINGAFGSIQWSPIIYQYKYIPFRPLTALYSESDVALVTPLRDGMNLIAKEYLACRTDNTGVLILSEMAGSAKELVEALTINPNNEEEIAAAIKEGLEMHTEEQQKRNIKMRERLDHYNVVKWAKNFVGELDAVKKIQGVLNARHLDAANRKKIIEEFKKEKTRLIFLDYDGTLVPFVGKPENAIPTKDLLELLSKLASYHNTKLVIISGRDRHTLEEWLSAVGAVLVAEHGVWIKELNEEWRLLRHVSVEWKNVIKPILERYTDLLPGSFVENKEFSLVWHYRRADPEHSANVAKELLDDLVNITGNLDVQVLQGSKIIEIRNTGINKGTLASQFLSSNDAGFILAIGDDWTDEDMFKMLPDDAYSIKVGMLSSYAKFNRASYLEVREFLGELLNG